MRYYQEIEENGVLDAKKKKSGNALVGAGWAGDKKNLPLKVKMWKTLSHPEGGTNQEGGPWAHMSNQLKFGTPESA